MIILGDCVYEKRDKPIKRARILMCSDEFIMLRSEVYLRLQSVCTDCNDKLDGLGRFTRSSQDGGEIDDARGLFFVDSHSLLP